MNQGSEVPKKRRSINRGRKMTITTLTTIKAVSLLLWQTVWDRLLIRFLLCTHRVTALWSITWEPGRLWGKICGDVDERTNATTTRHTCKHGHWVEWFIEWFLLYFFSEAFGRRGIFENSIKEHAFTIFSFLKSLWDHVDPRALCYISLFVLIYFPCCKAFYKTRSQIKDGEDLLQLE